MRESAVPARATRMPGVAQGAAVPVSCAVAAREGAVREGFLEKASVQAHMAHGSKSGNGNKSGKVGAVGEWSQLREQQVEGTGEHQDAAPLTQEWVSDEAGDGSQAEDLGALSSGKGLAGPFLCSKEVALMLRP